MAEINELWLPWFPAIWRSCFAYSGQAQRQDSLPLNQQQQSYCQKGKDHSGAHGFDPPRHGQVFGPSCANFAHLTVLIGMTVTVCPDGMSGASDLTHAAQTPESTQVSTWPLPTLQRPSPFEDMIENCYDLDVLTTWFADFGDRFLARFDQ